MSLCIFSSEISSCTYYIVRWDIMIYVGTPPHPDQMNGKEKEGSLVPIRCMFGIQRFIILMFHEKYIIMLGETAQHRTCERITRIYVHISCPIAYWQYKEQRKWITYAPAANEIRKFISDNRPTISREI